MSEYEQIYSNSKELSFFKLKEQFYDKYALLHSVHLRLLIPINEKRNYFFFLKKRFAILLKEAFSSQASFLNTKNEAYWEFYYLIEELLVWNETTSIISNYAAKYRSHSEYFSFLLLVKELKDFRKKNVFRSLIPKIKLSH